MAVTEYGSYLSQFKSPMSAEVWKLFSVTLTRKTTLNPRLLSRVSPHFPSPNVPGTHYAVDVVGNAVAFARIGPRRHVLCWDSQIRRPHAKPV